MSYIEFYLTWFFKFSILRWTGERYMLNCITKFVTVAALAMSASYCSDGRETLSGSDLKVLDGATLIDGISSEFDCAAFV